MKGELTYGARSLAAMAVMLVATQEFHPIVLAAGDLGETAAWLLILLAAALTAALLWPVAAALRALPGGSLIDLMTAALGRWGAMAYAILLAATLSFMGGMILRETAEMAISAAFPHTPQTFAIVALMLGSLYMALGDASSVVKLGRLLIGPVLGFLLLVLLGTFGWGELLYLTPLLGPGPGALLLHTPRVAMFFAPLILMPLLADGVPDRKGLMRWMLGVPLISGCLFAVAKANLMMVFAFPIAKEITFPMHEAARLIIGGRFFERIEAVWLFVWVLATTVLLGALLYGSARIFARAFALPRHTPAVFPLSAIVLVIAFFPSDQPTVIQAHQRADLAVVLITLVIPSLLAVITLWRKRRRSHAA